MVIEDVNFEFGPERIKRIRLLLGESQFEFAERIGVAVNTLQRWEGGSHKPQTAKGLRGLIMAERLAGYLTHRQPVD